MGFEALSCAIARVIINYHAQQTNTPPLDTKPHDSDNPLEHILGCSIDKMHYTIETKIAEATSENKTRLTLLEYMHFGFSLSERARVTSDADDIKALQPQLVQFIQNLQLLMTTTLPRQLSIPTNKKESLNIYVLTYSNSTSAKLIQELLTSTGLSPESTEQSIQKHIENYLEKTLELLIQKNIELQTQVNQFTPKQNTTSPPLLFIDNQDDDWETIINTPLSESYAEAQKRHKILNSVINQLKQRETVPSKTQTTTQTTTQTKKSVFCHTSLPPGVIMHNGTSSILNLLGNHFFTEKTKKGSTEGLDVAKRNEFDYS